MSEAKQQRAKYVKTYTGQYKKRVTTCACGRALDAGWSGHAGKSIHYKQCLICMNARMMQGFVYISQKERLKRSKQ